MVNDVLAIGDDVPKREKESEGCCEEVVEGEERVSKE